MLSAPDYLIGEKLLTYAETAVARPDFARELPRFVAEVRDIFSGEEIRHYWTILSVWQRSRTSRLRTRIKANHLMTLPTSVPQSGHASLS
jgi:hypothetical protein